MVRRVFYSFHYEMDSWRASQVRNMGVIEGNKPATDNDWESIQQVGDKAIEEWIIEQLSGKSCTIVLIGSNTSGRKWINYEIKKSWEEGKGVLGIYIQNLKNSRGQQTQKGQNPFETFSLSDDSSTNLSRVVKAYDPPYRNSQDIYDYIKNNISLWIEDAIKIRNCY